MAAVQLIEESVDHEVSDAYTDADYTPESDRARVASTNGITYVTARSSSGGSAAQQLSRLGIARAQQHTRHAGRRGDTERQAHQQPLLQTLSNDIAAGITRGDSYSMSKSLNTDRGCFLGWPQPHVNLRSSGRGQLTVWVIS